MEILQQKVTGQVLNNAIASTYPTRNSRYALVKNGVTNGDLHDHIGGDGGQVAYSSLSGTPNLPQNESGAANNFLTAYNSTTGAFSKAQPTWANVDKATSNIADITTKSHTSLTDVGTLTHANIDTYLNTAAIDYSSTSTIIGWSAAGLTKSIWYKQVGKLVYVWFRLDGTSDAITASFTLPTACNSSFACSNAIVGFDNGADINTTALAYIAISATTVNLYRSAGSVAWTASGNKICLGLLIYTID